MLWRAMTGEWQDGVSTNMAATETAVSAALGCRQWLCGRRVNILGSPLFDPKRPSGVRAKTFLRSWHDEFHIKVRRSRSGRQKSHPFIDDRWRLVRSAILPNREPEGSRLIGSLTCYEINAIHKRDGSR